MDKEKRKQKQLSTKRRTIPQQVQRDVLATWGNDCWLNLPGCTKYGEEYDHIIPYAHGGLDTVSNIRRACKHCNASRQDRVLNGYGVNMHIVLSPPGTCDVEALDFIHRNMHNGDILIAYSQIANSMHVDDEDTAQRRIAALATDSAYRQAARTPSPASVWHVRTMPKSHRHPHMIQEWVALDYNIHVIDPGFSVAYGRARNETYRNLVREWYALRISQQSINAMQDIRRAQLAKIGLRRDRINADAPTRPVW